MYNTVADLENSKGGGGVKAVKLLGVALSRPLILLYHKSGVALHGRTGLGELATVVCSVLIILDFVVYFAYPFHFLFLILPSNNIFYTQENVAHVCLSGPT